jgi:DNA-binding NtrC family response regulator
MRAFINYEWPGNVRELENAIERAIIIAAGRQIEIDDLPEAIARSAGHSYAHARFARVKSPDGPTLNITFPATMEEIEQQVIDATLEFTDGDKSQAARLLNIGRKTLYRKLEVHEESSDN